MTGTRQGGAIVPSSIGKLAHTLIEIATAHATCHSTSALLNDAVEIVRGSLPDAAVFVHLLDEDSQSLVLRAATHGDQSSHLNVFTLRIGEGVVGWVALTGKVAIINDDPIHDARYKYFPQVNEGDFRSGMAAPLRHQTQTIGVVSVWSTHDNAYSWSDIEFLSRTGELLASLVAATRATEHRSSLAVILGATVETFTATPGASLHEVLDQVAGILLHHLESEYCLIVLTDADGVPSIGGFAPSGHELLEVAQYVVSKGDPSLLAARDGGAPSSTARFSSATCAQFASPQTAGHGVIWCYRNNPYSRDEISMLREVASLLGLVIAPRIAHNAEYAESRERLFQLLTGSNKTGKLLEFSASLGMKPNQEYCAVYARVSPNIVDPTDAESPEDAVARVSTAVETLMRDLVRNRNKTIVHRLGTTVQALVPLTSGANSTRQVLALCESIARELKDRLGVVVEAGIGASATPTAGLDASLREAREALNYRAEVPSAAAILQFRDAVPQIYFWQMSKALDVDRLPYVRELEALAQYDLRKKSKLVHTLDRFLAASGNSTAAAERLHIHRNTMRQRLARIEELTSLPLQTMTAEELFEIRVALLLCDKGTGLPGR
jgi:sugar diacid utilization regulator/putative methionine-R-sulfoxide reductase with GAF domain